MNKGIEEKILLSDMYLLACKYVNNAIQKTVSQQNSKTKITNS